MPAGYGYGGGYGDFYGGFQVASGPPQDERARAVARDIAFVNGDYLVSKDGDWSLVESLAAMRQAVFHRLITMPGEFRYRPTYGCGLRRYVKATKSPALLSQLATTIRTQLLEDQRIDDATVTVSDLKSSPGLEVAVAVTVKGRRLDLGEFAVSDQQ